MSTFEQFPRITPMLWFDSNAEDAVEFYLSIFRNSKRLDGVKGTGNKVLTVPFELDGQTLTALNGGPMFRFNEAISLVVRLLVEAFRGRQRKSMRLA
jgi:predicted 3-demethylubiquinone-9 3-methyltransferase (glyoxalase superfamily)